MGTRCLTRVYDGTGKQSIPCVVMYRQFDGYPEGHGLDLAEFLDGMVVVNGIGAGTPNRAANGAGCLAAQLVVQFKEGIGGIYLETFDYPCDYVDYVYDVSAGVGEPITIQTHGYGRVLFEGTVEEFTMFCKERG